MSTAQQHLITAVVDGQSLGVFDTRSGGEITADRTKHRPGGMGNEKSYTALPTYGDVTIGRVRERERDLEVFRSLIARVGRAEVTVTDQPLDNNGAPWGQPLIFTGHLTGLTDPDADSNESSADLWQLTMVCTGRA